MTSVPPPHGMSEVDYEAIEAAVTETVRGRWFLSEFARRNRSTEMRQLLDAIGRIEATVAAGPALPSADPSIRMLIQRIKEVAAQLDGLTGEMRAASVDDRLVGAVEAQARAVAGLMRGGPPAKPALPPGHEGRPAAAIPRAVRPELPPAQSTQTPSTQASPQAGTDPRLALLSGLDQMPMAQKLALFA